MCRKCIKADVCTFKFRIGSAVMPVLKEKEGEKPEGMAEGRAVSLKEFEDVMDRVADICQYFIKTPGVKTVNITPEGIQ